MTILMLSNTVLQSVPSVQIPKELSELLNTLVSDDQYLSDDYSQALPDNFLKEIDNIVCASSSFSWETMSFLRQVKERVFLPLPLEFWSDLLILFICYLGFLFLDSKFKISRYILWVIKPIFQLIPKIFFAIIHRLIALFSYIFPILTVYTIYFPTLLSYNREFEYFLPPLINNIVRYAMEAQNLQYYYYAFCYFCIIRRLPRSRVVRFHIARSLMITVFQTFLGNHFIALEHSTRLGCETRETIISFALFYTVLNIWWIVPSLWQAFTLTYPRSKFIREAVELHLGQDRFDPDFKWWNRKKKKKK